MKLYNGSNAQFKHCSLIWMLHSHRNNNIIKNLHERCLSLIWHDKNLIWNDKNLIWNDKNLSYEELLTKDGSVSIHHRLWQRNCTNFKMDFRKNLLQKFFARETESHYNLRRCNDFRIPSIGTVYHGSKIISF